MEDNPKIVSIGAGSAAFYLSTLGEIFREENLQKATVHMVDINKGILERVYSFGKKISQEYSSSVKLFAETDREKALQDADFVILTIAKDREETWKKDLEIAKNHGIWTYAENGGIGAFGHTARNVATLMPILDDIRDLAPNAWIINFTNPLPRIHYAIKDYANLNCVSFCHQYWHGHYILGRILSKDLIDQGYDLRNNDYKTIRDAALNEYRVTAGGLNHFTWMLEIKRRSTQEDLYPMIRENISNLPKDFEALTSHVFNVFGLLPVPGETHLSEFLPYTATRENWDKYNLYHFNFQEAREDKERNLKLITQIIKGELSVDIMTFDVSDRLATIITKIFTDSHSFEPAINTENLGSIRNLPSDAIVEIPCILNRNGASGMKLGDLPEAIASLCNREISIAKLITQGSLKGDVDLIRQAVALDPVTKDLDLVERLINAYISEFEEYLPQFY